MEIITQREARNQGLKRYFSGKACPKGHVSERVVGTGGCCECARSYRAANREKIAAYDEAYRAANRESLAAYERAYRAANREKIAAYARAHYAANPEKHRELARKWRKANPHKDRDQMRVWREANPDKDRANVAAYRAAKLKASPPWLTPEHKAQIALLYTEAARLTRETGIEHHVDHIVPLKAKRRGHGQVACGLHVPWNLQVLPGPENVSKNCYLD